MGTFNGVNVLWTCIALIFGRWLRMCISHIGKYWETHCLWYWCSVPVFMHTHPFHIPFHRTYLSLWTCKLILAQIFSSYLEINKPRLYLLHVSKAELSWHVDLIIDQNASQRLDNEFINLCETVRRHQYKGRMDAFLLLHVYCTAVMDDWLLFWSVSSENYTFIDWSEQ